MIFRKTSLTVTEFFFRQTETFLIDTRGATDYDPAIPGSKPFYILDLMDNIEKFQTKYDAVMREKGTLLVCRKGDGTEMLRKRFSRKYQVMSLQGGMAAYLEFITRLLAEHPYEQPHIRDETMRLLLEKLTNRHTPFPIFRRIANRLLSSSPDPAIRQKGGHRN
ncbi:MAG: hypothetical protein HQL75_15255 [Magnetococcales bacterium]|nr:hypothetical protein [Magnetococcales bacterium]